MLIIGILAAIALPQYQKAADKANYVQLMTVANAVAQAQDRYYLANGEYSLHFADLDAAMPGGAEVGEYDGRREQYTYKKFYCHMGAADIICWLKTPVAGYRAGFTQADGGTRKCHYCHSTDPLGRAETLCKSLTGKPAPSSGGDCQNIAF